MGNRGASQITYISVKHLETTLSCKLVLKNTRYIPDFLLNLTAIGNLDGDAFAVFSKTINESLAKGNKIFTSYKMYWLSDLFYKFCEHVSLIYYSHRSSKALVFLTKVLVLCHNINYQYKTLSSRYSDPVSIDPYDVAILSSVDKYEAWRFV